MWHYVMSCPTNFYIELYFIVLYYTIYIILDYAAFITVCCIVSYPTLA